jgi:hypothetical protein
MGIFGRSLYQIRWDAKGMGHGFGHATLPRGLF